MALETAMEGKIVYVRKGLLKQNPRKPRQLDRQWGMELESSKGRLELCVYHRNTTLC